MSLAVVAWWETFKVGKAVPKVSFDNDPKAIELKQLHTSAVWNSIPLMLILISEGILDTRN